MLADLTIMATRASVCAVLYQPFSSNGGSATTDSLTFKAVSTLFFILSLLSPTFLNFKLNSLPSSVLAVTAMRFECLLWLTVIVVSGMSVTSLTKALRFFGNVFFLSASCFCFSFHSATALSASLPSFVACARIFFSSSACLLRSASFFCFSCCLCFALFCGVDLLKRSLAFFKKGTRLYSLTRSRLPLSCTWRLLAMVLPSEVPSSRSVPRTQLYVAL